MGFSGAVAQLGERLLCKQEVVGSIPSSSTIFDFTIFLVLPFLVLPILLCAFWVNIWIYDGCVFYAIRHIYYDDTLCVIVVSICSFTSWRRDLPDPTFSRMILESMRTHCFVCVPHHFLLDQAFRQVVGDFNPSGVGYILLKINSGLFYMFSMRLTCTCRCRNYENV